MKRNKPKPDHPWLKDAMGKFMTAREPKYGHANDALGRKRQGSDLRRGRSQSDRVRMARLGDK